MRQFDPSENNNSYNFLLSTPNLFSYQARISSYNSPILSPLLMIQSPAINNSNMFDLNLQGEKDFQLDAGNPIQNNSQIQQSSSEINELDSNNEINQQNILEHILSSPSHEQTQQIRNQIKNSGNLFLVQIYDYLLHKLNNLKKTKEEMTKYCMRKSFRYIIQNMKKKYPNYSPDCNQYLMLYFSKYCDDQAITLPFKKNSIQKTMNSNFLKKIFSCEKFAQDYRQFLKIFAKESRKDNSKKVKSMDLALKKAIQEKSMNSLESFKRFPWTNQILKNVQEFAWMLLESNTPKNEKEQKKQKKEEYSQCPTNSKKKSIILLTPPLQPLNSPLMRQDLLE